MAQGYGREVVRCGLKSEYKPVNKSSPANRILIPVRTLGVMYVCVRIGMLMCINPHFSAFTCTYMGVCMCMHMHTYADMGRVISL